MKTLIATLAAVAAVTAAAPAAAQAYGYDHDRHSGRFDRGWNDTHPLERAERRLERGVRTGEITRSEARELRSDMRDFVRLERRLARNGLSAADRNQLDIRMDRIMRRITIASNNRYVASRGHDWRR